MGDVQALEVGAASSTTEDAPAPTGGSGLPMERSWHAAWARYQGRSHVDSGVPCQDQVHFLRFPNGTVVGALADGAGSASLSHYGAELLIEAASELAAREFDRIFKATNNLGTIRLEIVGQLQSVLSEAATAGLDVTDSDRLRLDFPPRDTSLRLSCEVRDLASTLLLVAVKDERFVALHLGDGVLGTEVVLPSGRKAGRPLGRPDNGEFANETVFITSRSAAGALRIYRGRLENKARTISGFILMSDGPEASLYQRRTRTLAPACSKLLEACRSLPSDVMQEQLEATLKDVIVPRTHDDCSLVLLAAPHPGLPEPRHVSATNRTQLG